MKRLRSILLMLSVMASPCFAGQTDDCTFNQEGIAKELAKIASRNPGAVFVAEERAFKWRLASGEEVVITHGGCEDLGTGIKLQFARGAILAKDQSIVRLLDAVSQYWSREHAQGLRLAWQKKVFEQRSISAEQVEYIFSQAESSPFGFTITFSADGISLSWVEA